MNRKTGGLIMLLVGLILIFALIISFISCNGNQPSFKHQKSDTVLTYGFFYETDTSASANNIYRVTSDKMRVDTPSQKVYWERDSVYYTPFVFVDTLGNQIKDSLGRQIIRWQLTSKEKIYSVWGVNVDSLLHKHYKK